MHTNGKIFAFNIFRRLGDFNRNIYFDNISLEQAMDKQNDFAYLIRNLEAHKPKNPEKVESMEEVLKIAKMFYKGRNLIAYPFEENIFSLSKKEMS